MMSLGKRVLPWAASVITAALAGVGCAASRATQKEYFIPIDLEMSDHPDQSVAGRMYRKLSVASVEHGVIVNERPVPGDGSITIPTYAVETTYHLKPRCPALAIGHGHCVSSYVKRLVEFRFHPEEGGAGRFQILLRHLDGEVQDQWDSDEITCDIPYYASAALFDSDPDEEVVAVVGALKTFGICDR